MQTVKSVHWQDDEPFLVHLLDDPDYSTQGESLADLHRDLTNGALPGIHKVDDLVVP